MSHQEWQDYQLSGVLPPEFAEDLIKFFPEDGGLSYEEFCIQQESLYFSFKKREKLQNASCERGETSHSSSLPGPARASAGVNVASQLALDEALARSLQMDDGFDDSYTLAGVCESPVREMPPARVETSDTAGHNINSVYRSREAAILNTADSGVNPDDMSYEELQLLGDAIGHESKGLSDDIISRLPTFKYSNGFLFWKKKSEDECVICCSEYANRDKLASLLCAHTFHFKCIKRWLQEKKTCPICNVEVRDA